MLNVAPGVPFDVEIGATPTTGYVWQLPELPSGIELVGSDFRPGPSNRPGDGGPQVFHLRTQQPGHFRLLFILKRRWEAEAVQSKLIEIEAR